LRNTAFILVVIALSILLGFQQAEAATITATPKTQAFGPNDWIVVYLKVQGYHGGPISWIAHRPDNSTLSGNLTTVKSDGTALQQIIRTAFDNMFGNWSITYKYDNSTQNATFEVKPIVLSVYTDKNLYYEPDVMHLNITTSYYVPVANRAEFFHLNFYDQKGNLLTDIPTIDIRAFEPSVIYNFHMLPLADYHPPGLYKIRVQYYNTVTEVPFLVGKFSEFLLLASHTDKSTYQTGDVVNMGISVTRVTQSSGTLKITDPSGNSTTRQFEVSSTHTSLSLSGIATKAGTYNYLIQYGGITGTGSFNVVPNQASLPKIQFGIFPDKMYYRPGEIIHVKALVSQSVANSTTIWSVDPNGVEYPRKTLPFAGLDTILPHQIAANAPTGQWELYVDYAGLVRSVRFVVVGAPVDPSELLSVNQFTAPSFYSYFAKGLDEPSGIAIDSDNDVYVVDSGNSLIKKFDPTGKLLLSWGGMGTANGRFIHPSGIAVGSKYVFVADTGNARIQMFDKDGNFIYQWGGYGDSQGMFHVPVGLALDSGGFLFVADADRPTIQIFNSQDVYTDEIKPLLTPEGNFPALDGIAFGPDGSFYVSSPDDRVLRFSDIGHFVNFYGSAGSEDGRLNGPTALAVDGSGNLYVADTGNYRIQKFDSRGNFLASWGSQGVLPGQFEDPSGIAVDSAGNVYVADKATNTVQKFSVRGGTVPAIPDWVRERALWWAEGALDKSQFVLAVKYMVNLGLVNVTQSNASAGVTNVPHWLRHDARWWAEGQIDDKTFAECIEDLISAGILRL